MKVFDTTFVLALLAEIVLALVLVAAGGFLVLQLADRSPQQFPQPQPARTCVCECEEVP